MQVPVEPPDEHDPYGRLLERLTVALGEADNLAQLSSEPAVDMEVRGLLPDELALITAYLARDRAWLTGWHATAARQYQSSIAQPPFERQPAFASRDRDLPSGAGRHKP